MVVGYLGTARTWRALLVWLHVVSSVSWMSQAAALVVLLGVSGSAPPGPTKIAAAEMAELLDTTVLVFSANVSAATGFGLAAVTTWGYFHHWWVAAKFGITLVQLYAGIFLLSSRIGEVVDAARVGAPGPVGAVAIGAACMAGALAFQAWLSIAKPWGRTPRGRRARVRLSTAPAGFLALMVLAPIVDIPLGVLLGDPLPALSLLALAVVLVARRRRLSGPERSARPVPSTR